MPLPHPHGTAAGQIAHTAAYDTGDTPTSTGGKFIGFGENATSFNANRAHWALSENIDHIWTNTIDKDLALPAAMSFVSSGASTYELLDDVLVGDATYPGSAGVDNDEGYLLLFAVLDDQYNELSDGGGNEVRVASVQESGGGNIRYRKGGGVNDVPFETNPRIVFKTVDSAGMDVSNPYAIPAATNVRLIYGAKGSLADPPVDLFTRFKVQSTSEVEAGAFLQDGTKKMTGNADFDGYQLNGAAQVKGKTGSNDLLVRSFRDLQLQGDAVLTLKDQYLASPVSLSETGYTALDGTLHTSLAGRVNSNARMVTGVHGNRTLIKGGSITFTGGTGAVTLPAGMIVSLNGEAHSVGGQSLTATNGSAEYGCINASGTFVKRAPNAVLATDVVVTLHEWNGAAFTTSTDSRWLVNGRTGTMEVTVTGVGDVTGSGSYTGGDFTSIQTAVNAISAWASIPFNAGATCVRTVVNLVGTFNLGSTLSVPAGVSLWFKGDNAIINATGLVSPGSNLIDLNNGTNHKFERVAFSWNGGADQDVGYGLVVNPGSGCLFDTCDFLSVNQDFQDGIRLSSSSDRCLVRNCRFDNGVGTAVLGVAGADDVTVDGCVIIGDSLVTSVGVDLPGTRGLAKNNYVVNVHKGVLVGPDSKVLDNTIDRNAVPLTDSTGIGLRLSNASTQSVVARGNRLVGFSYGVRSSLTSGSAAKVHVIVQDNHVDGCFNGYTGEYLSADLDDEECSHTVRGNIFSAPDQTLGYSSSVSLTYAGYADVSANKFTDHEQHCITFQNGTYGNIDGNYTSGFGEDSISDWHAIGVYASTGLGLDERHSVAVTNNILRNRNSSAAGRSEFIYNERDYVSISGNDFATTYAPGTDHFLFSTRARGLVINGNVFSGPAVSHGIYVINSNPSVEEVGPIITDNYFYSAALNYASVFVEGFAGCNISNNSFGGGLGSAIIVETGPGASTIADMVQIRNNFVTQCQGRGPNTNKSIIQVIDDGSGPSVGNVAITGNILDRCGTSLNVTMRLITVEGTFGGGQICENQIINPVEPSSNVMHFIRVSGPNFIVSGNYLSGDVTTWASATFVTGIEIADDCQALGNLVDWVGSGVGPSTSCRAIRLNGSSRCMVSNNYIGNYEATNLGTAANAAIEASTCTDIVVVGNLSRRGSIDCTSGSGGMVLGNVSLVDGTIVGGHNTAGNV